MISIIENVFKNLQTNVSNELPIDTKIIRQLEPNKIYGKEISNILQHSKFKKYNFLTNTNIFFILYENEYYFVYSKDVDINVEFATIVNEEYFEEGFGILAISESILIPFENQSYEIYNEIFNSSLNKFVYKDIAKFYNPFTIIKDESDKREFKYI